MSSGAVCGWGGYMDISACVALCLPGVRLLNYIALCLSHRLFCFLLSLSLSLSFFFFALGAILTFCHFQLLSFSTFAFFQLFISTIKSTLVKLRYGF